MSCLAGLDARFWLPAYRLRRGRIIDANLVATSCRRNRREENARIEQGGTPRVHPPVSRGARPACSSARTSFSLACHLLRREEMSGFRLREPIADRPFRVGRRVTPDEIAKGTGIHRTMLSKIQNTGGYNTTTDVLDELYEYFDCGIGEPVQRVKEE